jgi:hypothetical protein
VFFYRMFYFVWSIRNAFPLPMCHIPYDVISTGMCSFILCVICWDIGLRKQSECNCKIQYRAYRMKEHITGGHDNIRRMTHGMMKSIRMDVKLAVNFQIREHSWPCLFHISELILLKENYWTSS